MAVKNIYIRPGDLVVMHVVSDADEEVTKKGWENQLSSLRQSVLVQVRDGNHIEVSNADVDVYGGRQQGKVRREIKNDKEDPHNT